MDLLSQSVIQRNPPQVPLVVQATTSATTPEEFKALEILNLKLMDLYPNLDQACKCLSWTGMAVLMFSPCISSADAGYLPIEQIEAAHAQWKLDNPGAFSLLISG